MAADAKVMSIVGGMAAGADSIDDLDVLRHGGLPKLFGGVRAPSTLGTFLRAFTWGHVRQLDLSIREFTCHLAAHTGLVPKGDEVAFLDIDSKVKQVYGPAKQGASFGYTKVRGLHFQIVTVKTRTCAPVIVATRLRKGSAGSGKGAASLLREALATVRAMGITAQIVVRADSAYLSHKVVAACRKAGARFSLAVAVTQTIRAAIETIQATAWTAIKYTDAIWDDEEQRWISDAEIAEIGFTAFTSKKKEFHATARLIVRRVKRLNPRAVPEGQSELFATWRHHVIFTDSRFVLTDAEPMHREHAAVEQVFADLEDSALAHLPSGKFTANAAWLPLAAAAYNLTRAVGHLACVFHARARTGTSAATSSTSRPASRPGRGQSPCTFLNAGAGPTTSPICGPPPASAYRPESPASTDRPRPGTPGEPATGRHPENHPARNREPTPKTITPRDHRSRSGSRVRGRSA